MRIGVDAMGGDFGPVETVPGAVRACRELGLAITLFGDRELLDPELKKAGADGLDIAVVHAPEQVGADEGPVLVLRKKPDSSIVRGMRALKEGDVDAFISAGNTGVLVTGSILLVGMMPGLRRPGLVALLPTLKQRPLVLVDAGASVDPKPGQLAEYAVVGSIYAEEILKRTNPTVGLINIGAEPGKGNELSRQAHQLLESAPVHFVGNIEAREMLSGDVDVVVADGFVGNVILKMAEGMGMGLFGLVAAEVRKSTWSRIGGLMLRSRLVGLKAMMDYSEYGGAPLFGPCQPVIKCHGASHQDAFRNGARLAAEFVRLDVVGRVQSRLQEVSGR